MTPEQEQFLATFAAQRDALLEDIKVSENEKVSLSDQNLSLMTSNANLIEEIALNEKKLSDIKETHDGNVAVLDSEITDKSNQVDALKGDFSILIEAIANVKSLISSISSEYSAVLEYSKQTKDTILEMMGGIKQTQVDSVAHVSKLGEVINTFNTTVDGSLSDILNVAAQQRNKELELGQTSAMLNQRENTVRANEERQKLGQKVETS